AGAGIGAFSHEIADDYLAQGKLVQVLPSWITGRFSLLAAVPSRRHMPARTQAFLDFLLEQRQRLQRLRREGNR
ncbi:MAG: LysR substrate-binding domain-containing protein, partial [Comamonas sp.]